MLKKIIFLFAAFLFLTELCAQMNIGSVKIPNSRSGAGDMRTSDIRKLERGTTIFFYGEKDIPYLEEYRKVAEEAWILGEFKFDSISNLSDYERARNTAFITLEVRPVYKVNRNIGTETEVDCQVFYHYWMPQGSRDALTYGRIDLFPEHEQIKEIIKFKTEKEKIDFFYKNGKAYNWNPGFMKIYLSHLSSVLKSEGKEALYEDYSDTSISRLQNTTLYAPQYILAEKDPVDGKIEYRAAIDLFEDYPFTYEIMKREDLGNKILSSADPFPILIYTQSGEDKHYNIYTSDGKLWFHEFEGNSFNLDHKDLKKVTKAIED